MKIVFDINCDEPKAEPAYRIFINDELITERDYVVPEKTSRSDFPYLENQQSDLEFVHHCTIDFDLINGKNRIQVLPAITNNRFWITDLKIEGNMISHTQGTFIL